MTKNLYILTGAPGSGKTTWVNNQIKEKGGYHVSRDKIRFSLLEEDEEYFNKEGEVVDIFINSIQELIDKKNLKENNIYVDATHLTEKVEMLF